MDKVLLGNVFVGMEKEMNAIITAATGYDETKLKLFLRSIKHNCKEADVYMIIFQGDLVRLDTLKIKYPFLKFVPIRKKLHRINDRISRAMNFFVSKKNYSSISPGLQSLIRYFLHIHIASERYFVALELLRSFKFLYSKILLTDCRDVIFQSNPFDLVDEKLYSGIEPEIIGGCNINSSWVKEIYGEEILRKISSNPIVCAGVTLGSSHLIESYLVQICEEIWKHLIEINSGVGLDQGVHNYLISEGKVFLTGTHNYEGLIATLHHEKLTNISLFPESGLVKVFNEFPAILHQYDRKPTLVEFLEKVYSLE